MSVYKNPKDGSTLAQMPKIATNIEMVDAPQENYVTQEELVEAVSPKQDIIQYETLPIASEDELGKIYQYIGETTVNYINGRFYKCVSDGEVVPTYSWQEVSFGGGSGGTDDYTDLINKPQVEGVTLVGNKSASDLGLQTKIQFSTMPTASVDYLNEIVQYIGETDATYTNGYFYKCVSDGAVTPTYSWVEVIGAGGLSDEVVDALVNCFAHVAWTDGNGENYIGALRAIISGAPYITSIEAQYNPVETIRITSDLNDLRNDLTVIAHYADNTSVEVTDYFLDGTLEQGISTITINYEYRHTTIDVAVLPASRWVDNVLTLTSDNLVQGKFADTYPYYTSDRTRTSYTGFDIDVNDDYDYTFTYTSSTTSTSFGLQGLTEENLENAMAQKQLSAKTDTGWKSSGYTITSDYIRQNNLKNIWITWKKGSSGGSYVAPSDITGVTITRTEV